MRRDFSFLQALKRPSGSARYEHVSHIGYVHTYRYAPEGDWENAGTLEIDARTREFALITSAMSDAGGHYAAKVAGQIRLLSEYPESGAVQWYGAPYAGS